MSKKLSCTVELNGKTYTSAGFLKRDAVLLFGALNSCSGLDFAGALSTSLEGATLQKYTLEDAEKTVDFILNRMFPGVGLKIEDLDLEEITQLFAAMAPGLIGGSVAEPESSIPLDPALLDYLNTELTNGEMLAFSWVRAQIDHHPDTVKRGIKAYKFAKARAKTPLNEVEVLTDAEYLSGIEYDILKQYWTSFTAMMEIVNQGPPAISPDSVYAPKDGEKPDTTVYTTFMADRAA